MYRNIEAERVRKGLTQYQMAEELGITPRTYHRYVVGITPWPSTLLVRMSELFGKSTDYLLGIEPE